MIKLVKNGNRYYVLEYNLEMLEMYEHDDPITKGLNVVYQGWGTIAEAVSSLFESRLSLYNCDGENIEDICGQLTKKVIEEGEDRIYVFFDGSAIEIDRETYSSPVWRSYNGCPV